MRPWSLILRRVEAALILPLVLLVSAGPDGILFRCHHDQMARLEPCCPEELTAPDEVQTEATLQEDRCCQPGALSLVHDASAPTSTVSPEALLPVVVAHFEPFVSLRANRPAPVEGRTRPDTGPPVLLKTRSLLI